jgi:hypothetical protein
MKVQKILLGVLLLGLLVYIVRIPREGYKNIDVDAQVQLEKILTKVLPENAVCIRGAQCLSGKCLENNNETTYGYCSKPTF